MTSALLAQKWLSPHGSGFAKKPKRLFLFCIGANPKMKTISKACVSQGFYGQLSGWLGAWFCRQGQAKLTLYTKGSSNFTFSKFNTLKAKIRFFTSWNPLAASPGLPAFGLVLFLRISTAFAERGSLFIWNTGSPFPLVLWGRFEHKQSDSPSMLAQVQEAEHHCTARGGCWASLWRRDTHKEASAVRCGCPVLGKIIKWQD